MSLEQTGALVRAHDSSQSIRPGIQAEALARAVAESMPGGVLVVDAAGVIALANRQIESQFGYSCAELVGQSIDILLPESSRAAHAAHRANLMAMPEARPMGAGRQLLCRRRDGSEFPGRSRIEPADDRARHVRARRRRRHHDTRQIEATSQLVAEGQLEFERLVAELSASFINLPADRVDDAVRDALRRIGEALDLDRCAFLRIQPDGVAVSPVFWHRAGIAPPLALPVEAGPVGV